MTSKRIAQTNQQQNSEKPQTSGILQRAAVRSVSDAEVQSIEDKKPQPLSNSAFSKDFSRVPISTTKSQQIMAKLTIGAVGDKYEQEADRVATQVVQRINAPASVQLGEDETVQREEMETKDNEARLMRSPILQRRSSDGGMAITPDLEASINQARGGGQPMANNIRQPMEKAFGADFSGVKIHTNSQSDQLNQSIQARAFTTGQDVFFRQGEYNPASRGGQELIAHELTHVVQQNVEAVQRSPFPPTQLSQNPDTESSVQLKPKDIKNTHTLKVDNTGIITNAQADRNDPPVSYPLSIAITKGVLKSKDSSPVGGHLFKREYGGADDYSNVVTWSQKSEDNFTIFENQYLAQARANAIGNGGVSREVQTEATFTDFKVDLKDIRLWINKPQMEA